MAGPDTFDPKRYVPFEKGLPVERVMSTFPAIDTVVDNIKFTAGLEEMAKVMDRGTLIRSHFQPDLGFILHTRHQYHWHTGYVPPQTVAAPHLGAWMAKVLGPRNPVMPAFVDVGQRLALELDRRRVDRTVERAEGVDRRRDERLHRLGVGDVGGDETGLAAGVRDQRRGLLAGVGGEVGHDDAGAGLGEGDGDGPAHATGATGHDRHLVGELPITHRNSPFLDVIYS